MKENNKKIPLDDLYFLTDNKIKDIEKELVELEKQFFSLIPSFENVELKLNDVLSLMLDHKCELVVKKIINLISMVRTLKQKRGYDMQIFQDIFSYLNKTTKSIPNEIVPSKLKEKLNKRILRKAQNILKEKILQNKLELNNAVKYFMTKNGSMGFLIPYSEKIWSSIVPYKKNLKIKIKSLPEPNVFLFTELPGYSENEKNPQNKTALLIKEKNGNIKAYIVDKIENTIILNPRLYEKKAEKFQISDKENKEYIKIKGERYFIRKS
ncbi:MAG: hypothetical protein OEZ22_00600 [Spirochaetia bacterium]|nr:hypothetical protein [Spirochaetia bacterium]